MTKAELVTMVAEKADLTKKDAEKAISALVESISETLAKGEKIQLVGFGTVKGWREDSVSRFRYI